MLATGSSAMDAITIVKKRSRPRSIKFLCIITAPERLKALSEAHPDVHIYCAAVDEKLNEHGYILRVSLGDAGDHFRYDVKRRTENPVSARAIKICPVLLFVCFD